MKKISLLSATALLGFGLLISSCSKDETGPAPSVNITPADDTLAVSAGSTVTYTVNVNSQDDLSSVKLTTELGTNQQILLDSTFAAGNNSFNIQFDLTLPGNVPSGTVGKFTVFALSTNGESTIVESYMKVVETMMAFEGVTLQAQADGVKSAEENLSFYSTSTNERFTYNEADTDEASALIDLVFTHHSIFKTNAEMSFQSPDEENLVVMWNDFTLIPFKYDATNKNETFFKKLANVEWDNLDYQSIDDEAGNVGTDKIVRGLNDGDYVAFETQMGKKGIIRINSTVVEHNPYNESTITFDVKVQY